MLPALVTAAGGGWVTQMQSKYGATAKHAADIWAGDVSDTDSQVYKTIGYYWHAPQDVDSNRGLGCAAPLPTRIRPEACGTDSATDRLQGHSVSDHPSPFPCSGGIQWAWDDSLCTGTRVGKDFRHGHATLEEQFREVRCHTAHTLHSRAPP